MGIRMSGGNLVRPRGPPHPRPVRVSVRWLLIFVILPDEQRIHLNVASSETIGNIKARLRPISWHDFELGRPDLGMLRDGATVSECMLRDGALTA